MKETEILRGLGKARSKMAAARAKPSPNKFKDGLVDDDPLAAAQAQAATQAAAMTGAPTAPPPTFAPTVMPSVGETLWGSVKDTMTPDFVKQSAQKMKDSVAAPNAYATGTPFVQGPGTGTSDSVHADISHGEAVLPAKTVKAVGAVNIARLIQQTNDGIAPKRGLKQANHFAVGDVPLEDPAARGALNTAKTVASNIGSSISTGAQNLWNGAKGLAQPAATPAATPAAPGPGSDINYDKPTYQRNAQATGEPVPEGTSSGIPKTEPLPSGGAAPASAAPTAAAETPWYKPGGMGRFGEGAKNLLGVDSMVRHAGGALSNVVQGNYGQAAADAAQFGGDLAAPVRKTVGAADGALTEATGTDAQGWLGRGIKAAHDSVYGDNTGSLGPLNAQAQAAQVKMQAGGGATPAPAPSGQTMQDATTQTPVQRQLSPGEVASTNRGMADGSISTGTIPSGTGFITASNGMGTAIDTRGQGGLAAGQDQGQSADPREAYRASLMKTAMDPMSLPGEKHGARAALEQMDTSDQSLAGQKYSSDASLMGNRMSNQYNMWTKTGELNAKKIGDLNPDFDEKTKARIDGGQNTTGAMARLTGTLAGMVDNRTGQPVNINDLNNNDIMKFQELHKAAKGADDWNASVTGKLVNSIQSNHPEFSNNANDYRKTGQDAGAIYPQSTDRLGNRQSLRSQDNPSGDWIKPVADHNARAARAEQIQQENQSQAQRLRDAQNIAYPTDPVRRAVNKRMDAAYNHSN